MRSPALNVQSLRFKRLCKSSFSLLSLFAGLCLLSGCERTNQAQFFGLNTVINVELKARPKVAEHFVQDLQKLSKQQQKQLYAWGDGELSHLNKALMAADCVDALSDELKTLLQQAKSLNAGSDFLFEPAIAPIVELWGFHDVTQMLKTPPDDLKLKQTLNALSSIQNLDFNQHLICASQPTQLDLGAIGKGWAAAKAAELLDQHNINNAMINFGGDLILTGKNTHKNAWRIGLKHPDQKEPPARLELQTRNNEDLLAVFTSGDYERAFEHNGQRYHHIIDPRTGYPATAVRSVTVVHPDPLLADAAATALFIAGREWKALAQKMSLDQVLVIYPDHQVEISEKLMANTTWLDDTYQVSLISLEPME